MFFIQPDTGVRIIITSKKLPLDFGDDLVNSVLIWNNRNETEEIFSHEKHENVVCVVSLEDDVMRTQLLSI